MCGLFSDDDKKELELVRSELGKQLENFIESHELMKGYRDENIMLTRYIYDLETTYLGAQEAGPEIATNSKYGIMKNV